MKQKKRAQTRLFLAVFMALVVFVIVRDLLREKKVALSVTDNAGVTVLETIDNSLICVFQDGQVTIWDWNKLPQQQGRFQAASAQAVILDAQHIAAVNKEGQKALTVYALPQGQKRKDISVAWEDQDVWLRASPDKITTALIRRNNPDSKGKVLYEFLTLNIEKEQSDSPILISIQQDIEDFTDYAVGDNRVLYAAGSQRDVGRIAAVDFEKETVLWDRTFDNTKEFCNLMVSSEGSILYAGNRDGILYKIDADNGEMIKKIQLLEEGETRPITNDYSVLNLAFSLDEKYLAATITPKAYLLKTENEEIIFSNITGAKLTSKTAFSPDGQFFATSDVRAGKNIYIHKMPEEK
ncbi:MAG: hypothetical protein ACYTEU_10920 [Planctomycetota bacterium]|jgi:WD40 repeat protein